MGFQISWLAVEGISKAALLAATGFADTEQEDEACQAPFSAADLGNGWSLIWSNDCAWAETQLLANLPSSHRTVAVQLHEGAMYSEAFGGVGSARHWHVVHDSQEGLTHLAVQGAPPNLDLVRNKLFAEQAADRSGGVDYVFDVPLEIAAALSGFRHDQWEMPNGPRPRFTEISLIEK